MRLCELKKRGGGKRRRGFGNILFNAICVEQRLVIKRFKK
jgi:hypothetical protein